MAEGTQRDNGLVTAITPNPNNPNVLYIGTAGGGVWRSRDGGTTWTPLFDRQAILGIGEPGGIAIDPTNTDILYVGTSQRILLGDANPTIFNAPDPAPGMFKSQDGGNSWVLLGSGFPSGNSGNALSTFRNNNINVIVVDPADSSTIYCASANGVWVSADAGQNWTLGANTGGGDVRSLVLDTSSPANARILYAGISGSGAFTSTDGGLTWTAILTAATPAVATALTTGSFGKVIVVLPPPTSPPNPAGVLFIYVTLAGQGGAPDPVGIFLSNDQGATWSQRTATGMPQRTQGGYSFDMAIDPASPGDGANDIIYFGTVGQARSTDAGATFNSLSGLHADTHVWSFAPQPAPTPSIVFCGCDGGISRSTDNGATWTPLNAGGLQTGLFYNIDVKPDAGASVIVGAMQDNAIETTAGAVAPGWTDTSGGDGWDVAYDGGVAGQVFSSSGFYSPAPCTLVFRSTNDGQSFPTNVTPWTTASDTGCYLAPVTTDPTNGGIVYVSGSQNLWQSRDGGGTWRIIGTFGRTGDVDVAATNGNNVVIAVGTQVFITTNALATTGVAFNNITRNLPGRTVTRARIDPVDPTIVYAVLGGFSGSSGGHVFRTSIAAASWTDISPVNSLGEQVNVPFNALALDGTDTPTTIYAGTDLGVLRSMDGGLSWSILDDLHFPRVQVSDLVFNPAAGVLAAATYGRGVFKFTIPSGPAIAVELQDNLDFGIVCSGTHYLTLTVDNVGVADLVISNVQRLVGSSDFTVLATPATPVTVAPGEEIDFTVAYTPSAPGVLEIAIIRITSNDPTAPVVDLAVTGIRGTGILATAIADSGDFGSSFLGSFRDMPLVLNNTGSCKLSIFNITATPAQFEAPSVASFPLVISPGAALDVPIRFSPTAFGATAGTVTISSNDPASPHTIRVTGFAPSPRLVLAIADSGSFGNCCIGSSVDEPLLISNSGDCTLTVDAITVSAGAFSAPEVLTFPLKIEAGNAIDVPIRFEPRVLGPATAVITVTSDDPAGPGTVTVTGDAPPGKLAVTGSAFFGGVKCCRREQRRLSICNVGACALYVAEVELKRHRRPFRLLHNPFPATLHPGSCLDVVIEYHAVERVARVRELVITSDDPTDPVRCVDVVAWTDWEECCKEGACDCRKQGREHDCGKGCHKHFDARFEVDEVDD